MDAKDSKKKKSHYAKKKKFESQDEGCKNQGSKNPQSPNRRNRDNGGSGSRNVETTMRGDNNPMWYVPVPEMLNNVARPGFTRALGNALYVEDYQLSANENNSVTFPGIARLGIHHGIGAARSKNDAINIASNEMFTFIRQNKSGTATYDPNDLMMTILAVEEANLWLTQLQRIQGLINIFSPTNRYFPRSAIIAAGFDYDDIIANLAEFKLFIQQYTLKLSTFSVPELTHLSERDTFLYSGIFADSQITQPQFFIPVADNYYVLTYSAETGVASLKYKPMPYTSSQNDIINFTGIKAIANEIIAPLINNSDVNQMMADIRYVYGPDKLHKFNLIPNDYICPIRYDEEFNVCLSNATFLDGITGSDITSDNSIGGGFLKQTWTVTDSVDPTKKSFIGNGKLDDNHILSLPINDPTPADVMVATRFIARGDLTTDTVQAGARVYTYTLNTVGTDICNVPIFFNTEIVVTAKSAGEPTSSITSSAYQQGMPSPALVATNTTYASAFRELVGRMSISTQFNWTPNVLMRLGSIAATSASDPLSTQWTTTYVYYDGWVEQATTLNADELNSLHLVAIQGLFTPNL